MCEDLGEVVAPPVDSVEEVVEAIDDVETVDDAQHEVVVEEVAKDELNTVIEVEADCREMFGRRRIVTTNDELNYSSCLKCINL